MKKIQHHVDQIDEELEGAKEYAECYLSHKAKGDTTWAARFKKMANDELEHAMNIHDLAVLEIEELKKVYTPPQSMQDKWDKSHVSYVERAAWIKQMLSM